MSLTCINVVDVIPVAFGSVIQSLSPAQFLTQFVGNTKTPTANFSTHFNGHTLSFQKNVPFVTTAALLAALTAQSAPIV